MSAPMTKDQFSFSLGNQSYIGPDFDDAPTYGNAIERGRSLLGRLVGFFVEWRRHQVVLQEMEMMTDRELADIGLARADLPRVFDPEFAADRPHGAEYRAY